MSAQPLTARASQPAAQMAPSPQATVYPQGQAQMRQQRSYATRNPGAETTTKDSSCYEGMLNCCGVFFGTLGSIPLCCCFPNPFKPVQQGTVGLITRFGRFSRAVDPGLYKVNPFSEQLIAVDIRMQCEDIPRQTALTKDNVSVSVDSVLYWELMDPYVATFLVANVRKNLMERTQTSLRMVIGARSLQDCIEHRDEIANEIRGLIDAVAESWGARVESILLKDIILGAEVMANISAAATQKRLGESKVIAAQAEVASAKLMREAADILASKAAMQIRYLETLQAMAHAPGTRVIFMPTNGMSMNDAANFETIADKN